uniref:G-protein coupled receptors family 1 profile domain-containing protein n=1 Tax=Romanomermis culicivorax TaxID=13658 RepID=A0A915JJH5_ROMCU
MVSDATNCSLALEPIFFGSLNVTFALPGLFLNLIFITTVLKDKSLRDNLKALILLAIGDFLISLYVLVYGLTQLIIMRKIYGLSKIECFYKRPHLILFIISSQWQSLATFIVALERMWAILFPFKYYSSDNRHRFFIFGVSSIFLLLFVCFLYAFLKIAPTNWSIVPQDLCYPTMVVCKGFSAYLFFWPVVLGILTVFCYVVVAFVKVHDRWGRYTELELAKYQFDRLQRAKQTWIIKISLILTATTFIFIVVPYAIMFFAIDEQCPGNITYLLRRYTTILQSTNSFLGMAISLMISQELRRSILENFSYNAICLHIKRQRQMRKRLSSTRTSTLDIDIGTRRSSIAQSPRRINFK